MHQRIVCELIKNDKILKNSGTVVAVPAIPRATSLSMFLFSRKLWRNFTQPNFKTLFTELMKYECRRLLTVRLKRNMFLGP